MATTMPTDPPRVQKARQKRAAGLLLLFISAFAVSQAQTPAIAPRDASLSGKRLGTVFNNDINNILYWLPGKEATPEKYEQAVFAILDMKPGVLAQNVGLPDPVIYRTKVATTFDKYLVEVSRMTWPDGGGADAVRQQDAFRKLIEAGTDPLTLTVAACRQRGIPIVASYRMNAEDWYANTYLLSDFGRAHPDFRIPNTGNLDPAIPAVYEFRMKLFTEVATDYDVDGIEFDFRRWYHMVSNPLENHVVLTRMVRDTRKMLDEVAQRKGRSRMLLGVRVGPSLDTDPNPFLFPGIFYPEKPTNASCKDLGLDVKTWIAEGLVDYVCPTLFLPSLPGMPLTREFAELAKGTNIGVYPTLFPLAAWMHGVGERWVPMDDPKALALYKYDLCSTALTMYTDGADGISTFNWFGHLRYATSPTGIIEGEKYTEATSGPGAEAVQRYVYPLLKDPETIRRYLAQPWAVPPNEK